MALHDTALNGTIMMVKRCDVKFIKQLFIIITDKLLIIRGIKQECVMKMILIGWSWLSFVPKIMSV